MKTKKTLVIGLNEINFDFVRYYISHGKLPSFKKLIDEYALIETTSEKEYDLLEPWVQWVTVHTGLEYKDHKIFRLGDIVGRNDLLQCFEEYESKGKTVAAVSPFNAENRLNNSPFFVPDPWTKTEVSGPKNIHSLSNAVSKMVNSNASSKFDVGSVLNLLKGFVKTTPVQSYMNYLSLLFKIKLPGTKAIILDSILANLFNNLWKKNRPDFSLLFLNSGAHIQHHYLFNSDAYDGSFENPKWYCPKGYDPLIKILEVYDKVLGKYIKEDLNLFVITGLHQDPHDALTFYWRLTNHESFLHEIGCDYYKNVLPRMSRDFLIEFEKVEDVDRSEKLLSSYYSDGNQVFSVDNRGLSLFVELVYDKDISDKMQISSDLGVSVSNFKKFVSFVAIKNGKHNGIGYCLTNTQQNNSTIPLTKVKGLLDIAVLG